MKTESVKKTALYEVHTALEAKMVPFAGYYMPVYYSSIMDEHRRVRSTVGLFDVSHMGEFEVSGADAEAFVQRMTTNDVSALEMNQVQYSTMCYPDGGIVDDLLVYRLENRILLVVNAANLKKDFDWLREHIEGEVRLEDRSDETTLLAVQGPGAEELFSSLVDTELSGLGYYHCFTGSVNGHQALISRTGYTGEDGFEIYCAHRNAWSIWDALMESGKRFDIQPIGLGARDTLRLEMKFALYGNDIDQATHPLEAGLGWVVKMNTDDFVGREVLLRRKEEGLRRKLIGFELEGRVFPRKDFPIRSDGRDIGNVTSGTFSPSLERGIGMGYVSLENAKAGTEIQIDIRGKEIPGRVVKTPFYKDGSHK